MEIRSETSFSLFNQVSRLSHLLLHGHLDVLHQLGLLHRIAEFINLDNWQALCLEFPTPGPLHKLQSTPPKDPKSDARKTTHRRRHPPRPCSAFPLAHFRKRSKHHEGKTQGRKYDRKRI